MMPIAAWAADFALFDLLALFAAIFFLSSNRETRSSLKFRSQRKLDPSFDPQPPRPPPPIAPLRPPRPSLSQANGIRAPHSTVPPNPRPPFSLPPPPLTHLF